MNNFKKYFLIFMIMLPSLADAHIHDGLVGWWKLDEASGNAIDSSGNGNTGTPTGTTVISNCPRNKCRRFDGASDFIDLGNSSTLNPTAITVSAWINGTAFTNAYNTIVHRGDFTYYEYFVKSNGKLAMYLIAGSPINYDGSGSFTLSTNTWYHVVMVYSSSVGLIGYVNGVQDGTAAANGNIASVSISAYIGKDGFTAGRLFTGYIDDVRIYNRVLSPQEVNDLYKSGIQIKNAVVKNAVLNK